MRLEKRINVDKRSWWTKAKQLGSDALFGAGTAAVSFPLIDELTHTITGQDPEQLKVGFLSAALGFGIYTLRKIERAKSRVKKERQDLGIDPVKRPLLDRVRSSMTLENSITAGTFIFYNIKACGVYEKAYGLLNFSFFYPGAAWQDKFGQPAPPGTYDMLIQDNIVVGKNILAIFGMTIIIGFSIKLVAPLVLKPKLSLTKLPKSAFLLLTDKESYLDYVVKNANDTFMAAEAISAFTERKKYDEAIDLVADQIRSGRKRRLSLYVEKTVRASGLDTSYHKLDSNPNSPELNANLAWILTSLGEDELAAHYFSIASNNSGNDDYSLINALFLDALGKESAEEWKGLVERIVRDDSCRENRIGETRGFVFTKGSKLLQKNLVVKQKESLEDALLEQEMTQRRADAFSDDDRYKTADVRAVIEAKGKAFTAMLAEKRRTFWDDIQNMDYSVDDFMAIARGIATVQARVPYDREGPALMDKLNSSLSVLDESIADMVRINYNPVLIALSGVPKVLNQDSHPENIAVNRDLSGPDQYIFFDSESDKSTPLTHDLVNLMEYADCLEWDEKLQVIDSFINRWDELKQGALPDKNVVMLAYLNGVVDRALALYRSWSRPDRQSMQGHRSIVVQNALSAINYVQKEHPDYYSEFELDYAGLSLALESYLKQCT